jgi:superfamily II DNA/RNA helicase
VPDAGGLVIATDHEDARAYAGQLKRITGESPTVILSDDAKASSKIEEFTASEKRWMVAVRMVSEGVDVPRLSVGVYATSTSTPLFFAQAVGRFVRARKRGETASVFLPSVPQLMALANSMELERDHALDRPEKEDSDGLFNPEDSLMAEANREDKASDSLTKGKFEALDSQASFDRVLFDGGEFGTGGEVGSEDELDFLGIPGLLDAEQVGTLLRQRQHDQLNRKNRRAPAAEQAPAAPAIPDHRMLMDLRNELAKNVAAWSARTGTPHGVVHTKLRTVCGGPPVAQANEEQLQSRLRKLQDWFIGRK